jgi:hypothetical protein
LVDVVVVDVDVDVAGVVDDVDPPAVGKNAADDTNDEAGKTPEVLRGSFSKNLT